ncbi:MAG: polyphosphate polymerase domain-containing protein [Acidimicrobiales bacterium]
MTLALHALHTVASRLAPASLDDTLAIAELQTRFDRKYILSPRAFHQLTVDLHDQMEILEIDGGRCFRYESVYFDTEDLASYFDTVRDRRRRFKVRTRAYLDSAQCALEVKTAGGRGETTKERSDYPFESRAQLNDDALRFIGARVPMLDHDQTLAPVLTTCYRRATLVDRRAGSRVTCDADLEWVAPNGAVVTLDGYLLVETKSTGAPTVADRLLWAAGERPVPISKFGVGLAALNPRLPANKWNRALRRYFGWTPTAAA